MDETDGFQCLGYSNWPICIPLNPFCSGKFPTFSLSYWEANSFYPRGPIMGRANSSKPKNILSRPVLVLTEPCDSDGEAILVALCHLRHHHLHPACPPVRGHHDCSPENSICDIMGTNSAKIRGIITQPLSKCYRIDFPLLSATYWANSTLSIPRTTVLNHCAQH